MLKIASIIVAVLIVAVLAFAALRPDSFELQRSITIQAAPAKVFALIDDFRAWKRWSPWEKMDPAMTKTHSGAAAGKGAAFAWQGKDKVGQGRMEITDASAPSRVII